LHDLVLYVDESVRRAPATPKSMLAAGQVGVDRARDLLGSASLPMLLVIEIGW
jgi:hypothetical protein